MLGSSRLLQAALLWRWERFPGWLYKASQQSRLQVTDFNWMHLGRGGRLQVGHSFLFPTHSLRCLQGMEGHEAAPEQGTMQPMGYRNHTSLGAGNVFPWKGSEYFTSIN